MMDRESLGALLEDAYDRYNTPAFIEEDPVSIPHLFEEKEDIEIAGFLTALIAWGRRAMIIRNAQDLVARMDMAPYAFVMQASAAELARLDSFVHRTLNGVDARALVLALRRVYLEAGGLEGIFSQALKAADEDVFPALCAARAQLLALPPVSPFRPRRWRGALLPNKVTVTIDVLECDKRPVNAVADHVEVKSVTQVQVAESKESTTRILTDSSHSWNDRIVAEQFLY